MLTILSSLPVPTTDECYRAQITWKKCTRTRHAKKNSFTRTANGLRSGTNYRPFPSHCELGLNLSKMGEAYHRPDKKTLQALEDMANKLRIHSIESTNTAGSG